MNRKKDISIVIPVKNGIRTLPECLEGIRKQSLVNRCEIVIIDSGSSDGSVEYLQAQKDVFLKTIPPKSFNHGLTRNVGVRMTKGELVVMTVQDAVATDEKWLEKMIRHFDDPNVAGVCGQQVVPHHKDKNPHQWFRPVNKPGIRKIQFDNAEQYDGLSPAEKKKVCSWDNVNAMYRREILLQIPFREALFSEDAMWAQDALREGYSLVYDTSARVYHYHYQSYDYTYKRTLTQLYFGYKTFGYLRDNNFKFIDYLKIVYRNYKYNASAKWIRHNIDIVRARNRAFNDFYKWIENGELILDINYNSKCKEPPQGNSKRE